MRRPPVTRMHRLFPARYRAGMVLVAVPLLLASAGVVSGAGAQSGGGVASTTVAVAPFRLLDTRSGVGTGGVAGPLGPGATISVQVAGIGSIPADATGALLNITATEGSEPSFVSAWPSGSSKPDASILNINPGQNLPNMVTVALGAGGRIDLYNYAGTVHLLADVAGYLLPGGAGAQGPPGPPGPSAVQAAHVDDQVVLNGPRQTHMDVNSLHALPAGNHLIQADLVAVLFSGEALVRCRIVAAGQTSIESSAWVGDVPETALLGSIAVNMIVSSPVPFDAVLQCKDDGLGGAFPYVESIQLHAIQVGSVRVDEG